MCVGCFLPNQERICSFVTTHSGDKPVVSLLCLSGLNSAEMEELRVRMAKAFADSPGPSAQADKEETFAKVEAAKAAHASLEAEREAAVAAGGCDG